MPAQIVSTMRPAGEVVSAHGAAREPGLGRVQPLGNVEKIARRSGEAVKPRDRHHVAGAELVEQRGELRPIALRSRHLFLIDALASCRLQRRALLVEGLVVG